MRRGAFPPRFPWDAFPEVLLHAEERVVKFHADYHVAKTGDAEAAGRLVAATLNEETVGRLRVYERAKPILVSAHAYESEGVNAIPEALADALADRLDWPTESSIVQINVVGIPARMALPGWRDRPPSTVRSLPARPICWWMILSGRAVPWRTCAAISWPVAAGCWRRPC